MNNKGISDLTTGNIKRQMIAFFIPMLLTNMLQQVYNFVDTLIGQMGFVATAVAEASAWIGALLINVFAYYRIFAVLRKKHAGCPV